MQRVEFFVQSRNHWDSCKTWRRKKFDHAFTNAFSNRTHAFENASEGFWDSVFWVADADLSGNVAGKVTHALKRNAHLQSCNNDAEVGRNRCLECKEFDSATVNFDLVRVDLGVVGDDLLSKLEVVGSECLIGLFDSVNGKVSEVNETISKCFKFFGKDFAHCGPFRVSRGHAKGHGLFYVPTCL